MRTPPIAAPTNIQLQMNDLITEVRTYRVITPLFGGGVEPGKADPVTTIRASEIRGHLRFWWRATRGGQFDGDLLKMREAEEALWGGATREKDGKTVGGQSLVQVTTHTIEKGKPISKSKNNKGHIVHIGDPGSIFSYGAFPLRNTSENRNNMAGKERYLLISVVFSLTISYLRINQDEIHASLWAWESFGGVGGRTRRGFGSIQLIDHTISGENISIDTPSSNINDIKTWFTTCLNKHVVSGIWPESVPHLTKDSIVTISRNYKDYKMKNETLYNLVRSLLEINRIEVSDINVYLDPLVAWCYPILKMQLFRQKRRKADNGSPYGRSHWPEPDEIRSRTTGFKGRHSKRLTNTAKFPRSAFGLPIIFKFKDEVIDPPQTTLRGLKHERLSSRLILHIVSCANDTYASIGVVLEGPSLPPNGLILDGDTSNIVIDTKPLTSIEAGFSPLNGKSNILQAFLDTL